MKTLYQNLKIAEQSIAEVQHAYKNISDITSGNKIDTSEIINPIIYTTIFDQYKKNPVLQLAKSGNTNLHSLIEVYNNHDTYTILGMRRSEFEKSLVELVSINTHSPIIKFVKESVQEYFLIKTDSEKIADEGKYIDHIISTQIQQYMQKQLIEFTIMMKDSSLQSTTLNKIELK